MKKSFLFVSPHPDDAELGAGGLILRLKHKGQRVFIVDLTDGEPTPFGSPQRRMKEAERAAALLGVDGRFNLGLTNRYLFDTKENRLLLAEKIRQIKPHIIFCPFPHDAHPDHKAASSLTEAARFYAKYTGLSVAGRPFYSPYLFYYFCTHLRMVPRISFVVDISEQFPAKMRVIKCYRSQFLDNPRNRYVLEYIKVLNRHLGMLAHTEYAEPFYSREVVNISGISSFL